jgi:hypothetical protein
MSRSQMLYREVSPDTLRKRPLSNNSLRWHMKDEGKLLRKDVELSGIKEPLEVCGSDCASPEYTILDGVARWKLAQKLGIRSRYAWAYGL